MPNPTFGVTSFRSTEKVDQRPSRSASEALIRASRGAPGAPEQLSAIEPSPELQLVSYCVWPRRSTACIETMSPVLLRDPISNPGANLIRIHCSQTSKYQVAFM